MKHMKMMTTSLMLSLLLLATLSSATMDWDSPVELSGSLTDRHATLSTAWQQYKRDFAREHASAAEEMRRFNIFSRNYLAVLEQNRLYKQGKATFFMHINQFSDMEPEEYGLASFDETERQEDVAAREANFGLRDDPLPTEWDWRVQAPNAIKPAKSQGICGTCSMFAVTGTVESVWNIFMNQSIAGSAQQSIDCNMGNSSFNGCKGASYDTILIYLQKYGLETEEDYPYTNDNNKNKWPCKYDPAKVAARFSSYSIVRPMGKNNTLVKQLLVQKGPMTTGIDTRTPGFGGYRGGVITMPDGYTGQPANNHMVLILGYGVQDGIEYWICRNSWGRWGDNGFFKIDTRNDYGGVSYGLRYVTI